MEASTTSSATSNTRNLPLYPLKNTLIDEYESGMEASVSSMASGGDDEDEDEDDDNFDQRNREIYNTTPKLNKNHRRLSSGSISTDSNATYSPKALKKKPYFSHQKATVNSLGPVLRIQSSFSKKDDIKTPNSGYDGDTEGPQNEDITNQ